jgi:hypothetical protein
VYLLVGAVNVQDHEGSKNVSGSFAGNAVDTGIIGNQHQSTKRVPIIKITDQRIYSKQTKMMFEKRYDNDFIEIMAFEFEHFPVFYKSWGDIDWIVAETSDYDSHTHGDDVN